VIGYQKRSVCMAVGGPVGGDSPLGGYVNDLRALQTIQLLALVLLALVLAPVVARGYAPPSITGAEGEAAWP
jgi:hypothetical protein